MSAGKKQFFLKYPADGGEPYFIFCGKKKTKSSILKMLIKLGYSEALSELMIETGYAFAGINDMRLFYLLEDERLDKEYKNNWHFGRADKCPYEIGPNGMSGYWEAVECLYENGLTWENAREEAAKGRFEEIMKELGRNIDEGPCDLSGWDSLNDPEISDELYWQIFHTDDKFPHTREQTINVIKILISFGYTPVLAQIFTAVGISKRIVARGDLIYRPIKATLRNKKSKLWQGLDKPIAAPYIISPEGEKCTYHDFLLHFMVNGDSFEETMWLAENIPLTEMAE